MKARSTRGQAPAVAIAEAIAAGLAPDGGLYLPETWPQFTTDDFEDATTLAAVGLRLLRPFFLGGALESALPDICADALAIDPPLIDFGKQGDFLLELFHGPTAAFKDYAAGFLAGCLAALPRGEMPLGVREDLQNSRTLGVREDLHLLCKSSVASPVQARTGSRESITGVIDSRSAIHGRRESLQNSRTLTVLVATSGDTGAAVAAAFHRRPGFRVVILYPDGRVAQRQAHQLGSFGDNVRALRVDGDFDACQRLVKTLLLDAEFRSIQPLGSANSISLGRLLPQTAYYAHAALGHWRQAGTALNFVIPVGNLGNALACVLARRMGLPIGEILLASNANAVLPEFFAGADYAPRPGIATLANAMDVGAPSNFERLQALYPDPTDLRQRLRAEAVTDAQIRAAIVRTLEARGHVICPHTACAADVLDRLRAQGQPGDWAVVATAHPAKFPDVVEPLIGRTIPLPPTLAAMLARPSHAEPLPDDADALRSALSQQASLS